MVEFFLGIDFANIRANYGRCWMSDDGLVLAARFEPTSKAPVRIGVDCPFGTSSGFLALLQGRDPGHTDDGYKTRATERRMREYLADCKLVTDWCSRARGEQDEFEGRSFFNGGSHVQPAVGMVIVPELLAWLTVALPKEERLSALRAARFGSGHAVEAHPRLFLYSAMERIRNGTGLPIDPPTMGAISKYKCAGADGARGRRTALELLVSNAKHWLPRGKQRSISNVGFDEMTSDDHAFDAWLSALTAWAHVHGETWSWAEAGLHEEVVADEGHILILKPNVSAPASDSQQIP